MTDEKKTSRWTTNLKKAGLIGEVEDAWTLPDLSSNDTPVIFIDDSRATEPPVVPEDDSDEPEVFVRVSDSNPAVPPQRTDPPPLSDRPTLNLHRAMAERAEMGDHSGALEIAEQILGQSPDDSEASFMRLQCRKTLMQMYESRIGSFRRIPKRIVSEEEIIWRNLDPVAGFIAASVDGSISFEDIIDISTLSRFDACRVLNQLLQDGIIR